MRQWLRMRFSSPRAHAIIRDDKKRPDQAGKTLILFFQKKFFSRPIETLLQDVEIPEGYEFSTDLRRIREAAAVVFHFPEMNTLKGIPRFQGQIWVGWSEECQIHRPYQDFLDQFDLTMSYKTDSDIFKPLLPSLTELRNPPLPKQPGKLISFFASNWIEYSGRTGYAVRLMRHLEMDCFGKCLNNRSIINDQWTETKMAIIANYRFNLAFENAIDTDYVTEKFYEPLIAGTVPVYLGAPNIEDFAPGGHCYIDARDFKGPKELAWYLHYLEQNEDAYGQYLEWKEKPFRRRFLDLAARVEKDPFTRLCVKVQERLRIEKTGKDQIDCAKAEGSTDGDMMLRYGEFHPEKEKQF